MHCSLCCRDIPENLIQWHHLIPKSKDGKDTIPICSSCHNFIHKTWTNNELRDIYNTIQIILEQEPYIKFMKWLLKQPIEKHVKTIIRNGRDKNPYH